MDDEKEAVGIGITLSTQLMSAALSMLAIVSAITFFMLDKRVVDWKFYVVIILSFALLIGSIIIGGKGIDKARKDGFSGSWNLESTKSFFNIQATLCVFGILFCLLSIFMGDNRPNPLETELIELNKLLRHRMEVEDSVFNHRIHELEREQQIMKKQFELWKKSLEDSSTRKISVHSTE